MSNADRYLRRLEQFPSGELTKQKRHEEAVRDVHLKNMYLPRLRKPPTPDSIFKGKEQEEEPVVKQPNKRKRRVPKREELSQKLKDLVAEVKESGDDE